MQERLELMRRVIELKHFVCDKGILTVSSIILLFVQKRQMFSFVMDVSHELVEFGPGLVVILT